MRVFADLHIHSKYSRAVSRDMDLSHLDHWAKVKGINVMGTGDFTHPKWFQSIATELQEDGSGLLQRIGSDEKTKFLLTVEISCIYSRAGKVRRIHLVVLMPDLKSAELFNARLNAIGNIRSDGRPILGLDAEELVKLALEITPRAAVIPAHIWTPWFSLFGSMSGFDSVAECFGTMAKHIFAIETGLSSDPAMNWRLSQLDAISITSSSDAHSPKPNKMGREATEFELKELTYDAIIDALKSQPHRADRQLPANHIISTIEFFPEEGKYHWDGHRDHGLRFSPAETKKLKGLCPKCGSRLTIGVEHRVDLLADRPADYQPTNRPPFSRLIPLEEIIAEALGQQPGTKRVAQVYERMTKETDEFHILRDMTESELSAITDPMLIEGIRRARAGKVKITPGYDGVFGTVHIFSDAERSARGQAKLF
ncbi:MAG: DNA helicase UvrD [Candidatus Kerfeldbacteria bacterium]|nr:DNA helicase UvrD [Candidatus Kerfeldbacteria bacterium]